MAEKKINYLARTYDTIRNELSKFSRDFYPEVADSFDDSSVGAWMLDLMAAVGDDLSYHTDRVAQEMSIDSANLWGTVMNMARENGVHVPGPKPSVCEIEVTCELPTGNGSNISQPDWRYAPVIQRGSTFAAGSYVFELQEDLNFKEQFNSDGYSNRMPIQPIFSSNGGVERYSVTKKGIAVNGTSKIYKKVLYSNDIKPFMEIVLPDTDVMGVESILFKETSDYSFNPRLQEFYVDADKFKAPNEVVNTYRYFECNSLSDQFRFGTVTNLDYDGSLKSMYGNEEYVDYETTGGVVTSRVYKGEWKPLRQKFITEYTDNGFLKVIFGAGNTYADIPEKYDAYSKYMSSRIINNDLLGELPKQGWTMFILYRVGGTESSNLGPESINQVVQARVDWTEENLDGNKMGNVLSSLRVNNSSAAVGGRGIPSISELKNLIKYNVSSQDRAVVINDYKAKVLQIPPKYGAPFRTSVIENNNKIEMSMLGLDNNGKLDSVLNEMMVTNMIEYLSHYKQINDYIEIRSGKIYNIGLFLQVFVDRNYTLPTVLSSVTDTVASFFDVNKHEMGEDIFIGQLMKDITGIDGVISLIDLRIYAINGGSYSPDVCPLPRYVEGESCKPADSLGYEAEPGVTAEEIDLKAVDSVLYSDYNSMYEIMSPRNNIQIMVKLR